MSLKKVFLITRLKILIEVRQGLRMYEKNRENITVNRSHNNIQRLYKNMKSIFFQMQLSISQYINR